MLYFSTQFLLLLTALMGGKESITLHVQPMPDLLPHSIPSIPERGRTGMFGRWNDQTTVNCQEVN